MTRAIGTVIIGLLVGVSLLAATGCDWYAEQMQPVICPACNVEGCSTNDLLEALVDRGLDRLEELIDG